MHGNQAFGKWVQRHAAAPRGVELRESGQLPRGRSWNGLGAYSLFRFLDQELEVKGRLRIKRSTQRLARLPARADRAKI